MPTATSSPGPFSSALRVGEGFSLGDLDPRSTPAFQGSKAAGKGALGDHDDELSGLQEKLFAASRGGDSRRRVLLVVQGMDTAGKGGIMRHVVGLVDPQGVSITAFKAPTPEERRHPFLWRIRRALPEAGMIGVFDRSHYEDVLIVRVHNLVPQDVWEPRYDEINAFERELIDSGTSLIKVAMFVSLDEQKKRLAERLDRPDKYWKYNPADIDERLKWPAYKEAYQTMLDRTSTDRAPWHIVPCNRKWYSRLAVTELLIESLKRLNMSWPPPDFDVEAEKKRLASA
jgi:PPK2 family polyphosphate:nucleotide phosphotransferase